MRLGFVSARKVTIEGDRIRTDAGLGRLIDGLAERSERITVALSPMLVPHPLHDHEFGIARSDLIALPSMPSLRGGVLQHRGAVRAIREVEERSDVVIVQLPFAAPTALLGARKPRLYHVCADIVAITPPDQFPQAVWDELVRQGKLKKAGRGMYELVEE